MTKLSRAGVYLALSLTAACSSNKPGPTMVECPPAEPASCPACPSVEAQAPQCPEPRVIEKIVEVEAPAPVKATTAGSLNLPIIGAVEWARVEPGDVRMLARIDTGAATTSIHAENIELVEKDGKSWVNFTLLDSDTDARIDIERRLRRTVVIKQGDSQEQRRYVVKLWISLGETRSLVEATLTDRDHMEYPLLIGRNRLMDTVIVDVSRQDHAAGEGGVTK